MRAAVLPAVGSPLEIQEVPDPTPGPGELVIKVGACGICGTDLHMSENRDAGAGWRVLDAGCVMGHEFSGDVVAVGREVRADWHVGDRVTALPWIGCGACAICRDGQGFRCATALMRASHALPGAYAEFCRIGAYETLSLPDSVGFSDGALVEPLAVGLNAIRRARLQPGDTVLIVGGGPVGLSVALWCRFFGAQDIIVSDLVAARAERALALGATAAVNAGEGDAAAKIRDLSRGGPDVVFDCVGVPGSLQWAVDYAPHNARVVIVGLCMAGDHMYPAKALVKELEISFAFIYRRRDFETVLDLLGKSRIETTAMVSDSVRLNDFPEAFEALKKPNRQIKVMLEAD